jgi:hypothetical protein
MLIRRELGSEVPHSINVINLGRWDVDSHSTVVVDEM